MHVHTDMLHAQSCKWVNITSGTSNGDHPPFAWMFKQHLKMHYHSGMYAREGSTVQM